MSPRRRIALLLFVLVALLGAAFWQRVLPFGHHHHHGAGFGAQPHAPAHVAGEIPVHLRKMADGFKMPTDLQYVAREDVWLIAQKDGDLAWLAANGQTQGLYLHADVVHDGEEGLLGVALHPDFAKNGRFFLNTVVRKGEGDAATDWTQIVQWRARGPVRTVPPERVGLVLEVRQPYTNHKAGQLQFGPDGKLYVGLGDGGSGGDPHGNGQNPNALLGKMLRLDVDRADPGLAYAVPADNPFVGRAGWRPEIWALGLRNPWRYSFDPMGRLIVADVGQNAWEEVNLVARGDNLGWNRREGRSCYPPGSDCTGDGMVDPVWQYPHEVGACITGGYVATGNAVPQLRGKYVVGDFTSGAIWALDLPASQTGTATAWHLTESGAHIATFGRNAAGDLWAADVFTGVVYALAP